VFPAHIGYDIVFVAEFIVRGMGANLPPPPTKNFPRHAEPFRPEVISS